MGALLSTAQGFLNLLLPFTNRNTPLSQDLIHTAILCGTLYYAPQIAEYYNNHRHPVHNEADQIPMNNHEATEAPTENLPLADNLVLQPDTDEGEELDLPPHAPTPPPFQAHAAPADAEAWQPENNAQFAADEAGPANERPRPTPANRVVGAKKAKSLARRDQRRAYHEFHRSQAEQRKLEEAEGKEEREAALAAEKARRAEVEREIKEAERVEREKKKEEERREMQMEQERRDRVVSSVRETLDRKGAVDLVDLAWTEGKDRVWVERLVRASGMLAHMEKEGRRTMITGEGWLVNIDAALMQKAYAEAVAYGDSKDGKVSFAEFGSILEKAVRARATVA